MSTLPPPPLHVCPKFLPPENASNGSDCGDIGLFLPIFEEREWSKITRVLLGVSIAADVFMASIERITSQVWRRKIKDPVTGKPETQEITVWNPTVANLSLLALGSSAPEILLSIIELCGNRFYSGQLGPSTIVGSAAFNLFIITGICVSSVPKHDIRAIEQRLVFAVTNITAIMAYLWLLFILRVTSPNQIDIWEALTTFFMFPILVVMAYLADRQFCCRKRRLGVYDGEENEVVAERGNRKVLAKDLRALARANPTLTSEQLASVMAQRLHQMTRHNRAYYRAQATNWLSNVRTMDYAHPNELEDGNDTTCEDLERRGKCQIEFGADQFGVNEVDKYAELTLVRCGKLNKEASIRILTIEHSAKEGRDFKNFDKILTFNRGEREVEASIRVFENKKIKRDLSFEVRIERLPREDSVELGRQVSATVLVVDQGKSNTIQFERKKYAVSETVAWGRFAVVRSGHFKERVSVDWDASDETAKNGFDYVTEGGSITFESGSHKGALDSGWVGSYGQVRKFIQVRILDDTEIEGNETFKLMLKKIHGKNTKLGDNKSATVTILDDDVIQQNAKEAESLINDQTSSMSAIGATSWKDQFKRAVNVNNADIEHATGTDYILHILTFGWKFAFAFIPPTKYAGGWLTFIMTLGVIGLLTAFVGDFASIFGCLVGLKAEITAITFVALGTSMPDLFASRLAARMERTADSAIGNVTGSNAVNVFLGLGIPWIIASGYWWSKELPFCVPSGSLGFNVAVFTALCIVCTVLLYVRRGFSVFGKAELGGPTSSKYLSAAFLTTLWFVYIVLAILQVYDVIEGF